MLNFIKSGFHSFQEKTWRPYALNLKKVSVIILFSSFIFLSKSFGQAGDLSQIRNGSGKTSQQGVLDTCGTCWVNGNAGASNAHYVEGMSIPYRALITGLQINHCYEYELGYDTYHGAVAIDYLTHFQRLQPHQPFGHIAEVIDPTFFVSGSNSYHMTLVDAGGANTFTIPPPASAGVVSGTFNADGTARDDSQQPVTSFTALPASEKLFTIYNGAIDGIFYINPQPTIIVGGADQETRVRISFTAHSDSVVLAWGGHIASRLDWGYSSSHGKLTPLSAGGISGSPYHMRQKAFDEVTCGTRDVITSFSGFGNTDRSLSAAAVVPPPTCPTVGSQAICTNGSFSAFTISNPVANTTYSWTISSNTASAQFSGGGQGPVTGTSVSIIAQASGFTAGSFNLDITATLNSIPITCPAVATGTVNPLPTANAGTAPAAQCAAAGGNNFALDGTCANGTTSWAVQSHTGNAAGSFNSGQTSCDASVHVDGVGTVTFRLSVASASCGTATSDVTVTVNPNPTADAGSPPAAQCAIAGGNTFALDGTCTNGTASWAVQSSTGGAIGSFNSGQNTCDPSVKVTGAGTVTFRLSVASASCGTATSDVTVTVTNKPAAPLACFILPSLCANGTTTGTVLFNDLGTGYQYSIDNGSSFHNCRVFPGLAPGAVTGLKVKSGDNCISDAADCSTIPVCASDVTIPTCTQPLARASSTSETIQSETTVKAYPNPFSNKINFVVTSPVSGKGSLDVYNMMGQKVRTVYQGFISAGTQTFQMSSQRQQVANLIYVLRIGDKKVTGRILQINQ